MNKSKYDHLKTVFISFLLILFSFTVAGQSSINYVRIWTATAPEQSPNTLITRVLSDVKQVTQYYDGLGRSVQTVAKQGSLETSSGNNYDLVSMTGYDNFSRENAQYLPYVASSADGTYKLDAFTAQPAYYNNSTNPIAGQGETGSNAHTQINFEPSPLNRVILTMAPGNSWVGNSKGIGAGYYSNTSTDDVRMFSVANNGIGNWGTYTMAGSYPTGTLYKNITVDENGNQVVEFKDLEGKVILKKVANGVSDGGSGSGYTNWLCTYYIYDILNNLRCVIQPAGVQVLTGNGWSFTGVILSDQCFRYEYDQRNRMVMKQVPGAGCVYMVYNVKDLLVMTQDANMRSNGQWMVTVYDTLDRPVKTGLLIDANGLFTEVTNAYYSTSTAYPNTSGGFELLTQTGYDNYTTMPAITGLTSTLQTAWNGNFSATQSSYPYAVMPVQNSAVTTQGLATWTQAEVLGSNGSQYITTVNIYDDKSRVIQTQNQNYSGGIDVITTQYTWGGQPLVVVQSQQKGGTNAQTTVTISKMTYDELNRLTATTKQVQNTLVNGNVLSSVVNVSNMQYDALGQLKTKSIGGMETQTFDYNIRGWLLGVNRNYVKDETTNTTNNGSAFDGWNNTGENFDGAITSNYFGFELSYDKSPSTAGAGGTALQYNGNIAGMVWKGAYDKRLREYNCSYDAVNRLLSADFNQYIGSSFNKTISTGTIDFSVSGLSYDANGNILSMTQKGMNVNVLTSTTIDNLSYNYQSGSNKLNQVSDAANGNTPAAGTTNYLGDYHYASGAGSGATYTYDVNGNLTSDGNKNISSIAYNVLNLPQTITVSGKGSIVYTYDAAGNKLQKQTVDNTNGTNTTTLYDGGIIYINNNLQFVATEEGRLRVSNSVWIADYYLKDHLGNTRMVITSDGSISTHILEWTNYYPFGLTMKGISSQAAGSLENKYKFNKGSELQHQEFSDGSGLEWYDTHYRQLDVQLGRWNQPDFVKPNMAESLYAAMGDNPILHNDPLGDTVLINYKNQNIVYNNGKLTNKDGSAYGGKVKGYLGKVVNALQSLNNTAEGKSIVNELQNSTNNFSIKNGLANSFTPSNLTASYGNIPSLQKVSNGTLPTGGSGGTIVWNPGISTSGMNTAGNTDRPAYIGLGHEMAHGRDANQGTLYIGSDYTNPLNGNSYLAQDQGLNKSEWRAVYYENIIRGQAGLPLRSQYGLQDNGGSFTGTGPSLLTLAGLPINFPIQ